MFGEPGPSDPSPALRCYGNLIAMVAGVEVCHTSLQDFAGETE